MHVRIAWEIYHHQTKQNPDKSIPGLGSSLYSLSSLGPSGTPGGIGGGALPLHGSGASGGGGAPTVAPKPTTDPLLRPPSHLFSHIRPSPFGQPQQLPPAYLAGEFNIYIDALPRLYINSISFQLRHTTVSLRSGRVPTQCHPFPEIFREFHHPCPCTMPIREFPGATAPSHRPHWLVAPADHSLHLVGL